MRLPTEAQLSDEQREVCFARSKGTMLVIGPPGSGKTVVAHFRAELLRKKNKTVSLVMFNRVLRQFTKKSETFHAWVARWWRGATRKSIPVSFVAVGEKTHRVWDFETAREQAVGKFKAAVFSKGHWGHLIVDEAQDFDRDVHRLLFVVQHLVFADADEPPSLLVLADENQRISEANSTIDQIRETHMLARKNEYVLERNYRNTREIARVAAQFYVGLPTGIPALPDVRGEQPQLVCTENLNAAVDRIVRYARLHANEEIGVLVLYEGTRRKIFNKLSYRLKDDTVLIQTYTSTNKELADDLVFDKGGVVTVLCFASAKGLEFDTVFLPELQTIPTDGVDTDRTRMQLYVMTSRARKRLFLMTSSRPENGGIWDLLEPLGKLVNREEG